MVEQIGRVFSKPNSVPGRLVKMSFREKVNALVFDLKHIHNLRRRFYAYWDGAPTRIQGVMAFGVFLARVALRMNAESTQGEGYTEKPLSEMFAHRVVK